MRHGSRRAKGRRLQVAVAEALSARFKLKIEAVPPTRSGTRENGAIYVAESAGVAPDLRIRPSGDPGVDVALLSAKARQSVRFANLPPMHIECKNVQAFVTAAAFWHDGALAVLDDALEQVHRSAGPDPVTPLVVLSKNNHPPVAAVGFREDIKALGFAHWAINRGVSPTVFTHRRRGADCPYAYAVLMPFSASLTMMKVAGPVL